MRPSKRTSRPIGRRPLHDRVRRIRPVLRRRIGGRPGAVATPTLVASILLVFAVALAARVLLLADQRTSIEAAHEVSYTQPRHYQNAGRRILDDPVHALLFDEASDRGRERMLVHPPGYPLLIAGVFGTIGGESSTLRWVQLVIDALSAVLLYVIGTRLFRQPVALAAGLCAAVSPQLAWNALVLQPDTVAITPLLGAVLAIVWQARPTLRPAVAAGALIGISCWLRSNTLLLAPFLAVFAVPLVFPRGQRRKAAAALVLTTAAVIAPVTLRNWIVFDRFIPLSLGAGITFAEGIGDFDPERRFGIPSTDVEIARADAQWAGRPDYALSTWVPDGIERDRERFRRAADVAIRNPAWFASVMLRRAALMLRCNDGAALGWPADSARAPLVSLDPPFGHDRTAAVPESGPDGQPLHSVRLSCGQSQFVTSLQVDRNTDVVLRAPVSAVAGAGFLDVRDDTGSLVASLPVREQGGANARRRRKANRDQRVPTTEIVLPIATTDSRRLDVTLRTNEDQHRRGLSLEIGRLECLDVGPTPGQWTRGPRWIVRSVQRHLFITSRWPLLVLAGGAILFLGSRRRALIAVAVVPLYYMVVQSALHTEFRYVLAVHALSTVPAAVALVVGAQSLWAASRGLLARARLGRQAREKADPA